MEYPPTEKPNKTPGLFRRGLGFIFSPRGYVPVKDIRDGGAVIGELIARIRAGKAKGRRQIRFDETGHFDIAAMAFDAACAPAEIERRMANRRAQTRQWTLGYLVMGSGLLIFWAAEGTFLSWRSVSLVQSLLFFAVVGCFFLLAFYQALVNWQIRCRRLGSVREFLLTNDSWWPR
jgi:hypothetical protein